MGVTITSESFSLPSIEVLSFLPFIFLQIILLHPNFNINSKLNRIIRFLLLFPAAYLAFKNPFIHGFSPYSSSIGANFRLGIAGPYAIMKALEWGTAKERGVYTWIGFDRNITTATLPNQAETIEDNAKSEVELDETVSVNSKGSLEQVLKQRIPFIGSTSNTSNTTTHLPSPSPSPSPPPRLDRSLPNTVPLITDSIGIPEPSKNDKLKLSPSSTSTSSTDTLIKTYTWTEIILDSLHLVSSMRGIGYAFGPPTNSLAKSPSKNLKIFVLNTLKSMFISHVISTLCLILIIHQYSLIPTLLSNYLPFTSFIPKSTIQIISNILAYTSVGVSLHAQMNLGFYGFSLLFLSFNLLLRQFLPPTSQFYPSPFEVREWTPLFNEPFKPQNVTIFWKYQWHAMFRVAFLKIGFEPTINLVKKLRLGKSIGKMFGTLIVFGLSAWMHDQALWSARHQLPQFLPPLSFTERFGGQIYFFSQALAIILEGIYTQITRKKVNNQNLIGMIWSYSIIIGLGLIAGRSWISLGLVKGLPEIHHWSWERFLLPTVALAPSPVFTI